MLLMVAEDSDHQTSRSEHPRFNWANTRELIRTDLECRRSGNWPNRFLLANRIRCFYPVPQHIQHVGWWAGSAYAGDPFGSTVIAGHVDSRLQGLGFFAELLLMQVGDLITLRADTHTMTYRVVSARLVDKEALASDNQALDQRGPHRLVLITCSGQWHPEVRSYASNLVVVADPVVR